MDKIPELNFTFERPKERYSPLSKAIAEKLKDMQPGDRAYLEGTLDELRAIQDAWPDAKKLMGWKYNEGRACLYSRGVMLGFTPQFVVYMFPEKKEK